MERPNDKPTSTTDRRSSERRPYQTDVALMMAAGTLEGETVNISSQGALIRATGAISVVIKLNGREHRGRLVRATPIDRETITYAVHLDDPLD